MLWAENMTLIVICELRHTESAAAGAAASFPTRVCFLERDPTLHDYTI